MPIYEYQCPKCGHIFEEWVHITSASSEAPCPQCGKQAVHIISNTAFVLKGGGWYVTDYGSRKSDGHKEGQESSGSDSAPSASPAPSAPSAQGAAPAPSAPSSAPGSAPSSAPTGAPTSAPAATAPASAAPGTTA